MKRLTVMAVVLVSAGAHALMAGTFRDDFADGKLDGTYWNVIQTDGATTEQVQERNGRLEFTNFVDGWEGAGVRLAFPLDMRAGPLAIEFDLHQRIRDFHPYITNFKTEGRGSLWNKGIFAFNTDAGVLGFEHDKVLGATANPPPNLAVDAERSHRFRHVYTPTGKAKEFTFTIAIDDGATGKAEGLLNVGALNPSEVYLYFELEQKLDAKWNLNEFAYLDNVLVASDSIQGNVGPSPLSVGPRGRLALQWAAIRRGR
jgi:hypothetical protein